MIRALLVSGLILLAACGSKNPAGPCDTDPPSPECMQACDPTPGAANSCPPGWHCTPDGLCFASCTQGGSECGGNAYCSPDGECIPIDGDAALGPDADCPDVTFTAMPVTPTIQLLLDKSGSMDSSYGGGQSRWEALENALVGPSGVVGQYQALVYFGATLYTNDNSCPELLPGAGGTGRALNNLAAIQGLIGGSSPGGGTPTAPSLTATYQDMIANPPPAGSPPIIVLATDGQPYTCPDNNNNAQAQQEVIAAAQAAYAANIPTFVLGIAPASDTGLNAHLQQVANAGAGQDPVTGTATYYPASNPMALADAFATIIGGVVTCDLQLDGAITPEQAANGQVTLNGNPLAYGTDWTLIGDDIIRLTGQACTDLMNSTNPSVVGTFPCGGVIE
jgi:hypothetical protein